MLFCTVDQVKEVLDKSTSWTDDDLIISRSINITSSLISKYCRRNFGQADYTQYFGSYEIINKAPFHIWLKNTPASNVVIKINYDYRVDWADVEPLPERDAGTNAQNYSVDSAKGKITLLQTFASHPRSIKVSYTAGYPDDLPEEITNACILHASFLYKRLTDKNTGQSKKTSAVRPPVPLSVGSSIGLIPEAKILLAEHRRTLVGKYGRYYQA